MPYISQEERKMIDESNGAALTPGRLNYKITKLIVEYLNKRGIKWETINDIMGTLESAKTEFTRRVVAPYEDDAIKRNGDLYDLKGGKKDEN